MRHLAPLAIVACLSAIGLAACSPAPAPQAPAPVAPVATTPPAAPQFADLRGARASSGEGEMQRRGFTVARQRGLTAYWLNAASGTCVRTVTAQGRYQTVDQVAASHCGR